jgi:hypothetical protein
MTIYGNWPDPLYFAIEPRDLFVMKLDGALTFLMHQLMSLPIFKEIKEEMVFIQNDHIW